MEVIQTNISQHIDISDAAGMKDGLLSAELRQRD